MSKTNNLPSHRVYAVTKEGKQSYWRAIGAVWPHGDGQGFNMKLDYLPAQPRRRDRYPQAESRGRRSRSAGGRSRLSLRGRLARDGPFPSSQRRFQP
jgi:hypothetical protein